MVTISQQELQEIDKILEKQEHHLSPTEQAQLRQAIIKVIEKGPFYKDAFGISDKIMETCYNHAYNLFQAGKYQEAVKIFENLKEMDFKNPRYSLAAAVCYHYLKDYDKAIGNYYICKEIDVFNPVPSFHLYDCLMQLNQPQLAIRALAEVIVRSGNDPRYQALKEKALLEKDDLLQKLKTWVEQK